MRCRRLSLVVVLAVAALVRPSPAAADDATSVGGWIEGGTPTVEVGVPGSGGGEAIGVGSGGSGGSSGGGGSGGGPRCTYERLPDDETILEPDGSERTAPGEGAWYIERCVNAAGQEISWNVVFIPAGEAPGAQVDPLVLAQRALRQLPLTGPSVVTSPPSDRDQLVNLATWLWVDDGWQPLSATASVPGVSVTVTATPTSVAWAMGAGDVVVCDGPGTPYDAGRREEEQSTDCSYTYRQSSAGQPGQRYPVTTTQTWSVSWSASGIAGGGDLGTVSRSMDFSLRVAEGQALVTAGR